MRDLVQVVHEVLQNVLFGGGGIALFADDFALAVEGIAAPGAEDGLAAVACFAEELERDAVIRGLHIQQAAGVDIIPKLLREAERAVGRRVQRDFLYSRLLPRSNDSTAVT